LWRVSGGVDEAHARGEGVGRRLGGGGVRWDGVVKAPGEGEDSGQENDRSQGDKSGVDRAQSGDLAEVDEAVEDGNDVIDAKDKGVEDRGAAQTQAEVEVV
jgi:hypothetical protein